MLPRTIVSFEADFPLDGDDGEPSGHELAEFVAAALRAAHIDVEGPEERDSWAWELAATIDGLSIESTLGIVDDPPIQWLIMSQPRVGFLAWLRGRKHVDQQWRFFNSLTCALKNDSRFRSIRWYYQRDFDSDHGATYNDVP